MINFNTIKLKENIYIYTLIWKRYITKYKPNPESMGEDIEYKGFSNMFYTGITKNIRKIIRDHLDLKGCRTTKIIIKRHGYPFEIRYKKIKVIGENESISKYEHTFKKYNQKKKLKISKDWTIIKLNKLGKKI